MEKEIQLNMGTTTKSSKIGKTKTTNSKNKISNKTTNDKYICISQNIKTYFWNSKNKYS